MSILPNYFRSLILAIILSFIAPILLVCGVLFSISLISYIPGWQTTSQVNAILQFLATFGSGNSWRGLFVISLTCSLVGALFDTYAFYRYQYLRDR